RATIESPPTRASGTQDVLILIAVLDFRVVLYPEPSTPDVQAVHTVHSTGNLVEAAGKHRGWIEVLRSVRVVIDRRQIGARADCRECRADAQDLVSHSDLSPHGRTDMVKPMLRAVGSWPFSTPWRLPVSNAVSGSMVGCLAHRIRLRPTTENVASEKPRNRDTEGGSA